MRRIVFAFAAAGALLAGLLSGPAPALAWGPEAHRTIALMADRILAKSAPAARAKLHAILASDKDNRFTRNDLASEAIWADVLMDKSPEARSATSGWHDVRMKAGSPDLAAACAGHRPLPAGYPASRGPRNNCAVDKVEQFAKELQDSATEAHERVAAVRFLLNLVGDLNDPLNTIDHGDRGGECVAIQVGSRPPMRLADYWEDRLVREVVGPDPARGATRILASVPEAAARKWAEGTPADWARDSYEVARSVVYSFAGGKPDGQHHFPTRKGAASACATVPLYRVGADYETKALAAVKLQLEKGGVRLARVLADSLK